MAVLFDTTMRSPAERSSSWLDAHRDIFFPISVRFASPDCSRGRIEGQPFGPLQAYRVRSDPSVVHRSAPAIRAFDPEQLVVAMPLRGRTAIEQAGRRTLFGVGELSSWDSSRPFTVVHPETFDLLLMIVPHGLLGSRAARASRQTAANISERSGLASVAAGFFRQTWATLGADDVPGAGEDLADAAIALVRALHAPERDLSEAARPLPSATVLAEIKRHIELNLGLPTLGPESIARAHSISKRYLHALFAREQITVSGWIRHRRLEACRRDLRDAALAHESVSMIARRWALSNPAHFSRIFRAAYGCSPTEFRHARPGELSVVRSRQTAD